MENQLLTGKKEGGKGDEKRAAAGEGENPFSEE